MSAQSSDTSVLVTFRDLIMDLLDENQKLKQKEFTVSVELLLKFVRYKQRFSTFFIMCESLPEQHAMKSLSGSNDVEHKKSLIKSAEIYLTRLATNLLSFFIKCQSLKDGMDAMEILDKEFPWIAREQKDIYCNILNEPDVRKMISSISLKDEIFMRIAKMRDFKSIRCYLVDHIVNMFCDGKIEDIKTPENQEYLFNVIQNASNYKKIGYDIPAKKRDKITKMLGECTALGFLKDDNTCVANRLRASTLFSSADYTNMDATKLSSSSSTKRKSSVVSPELSSSFIAEAEEEPPSSTPILSSRPSKSSSSSVPASVVSSASSSSSSMSISASPSSSSSSSKKNYSKNKHSSNMTDIPIATAVYATAVYKQQSPVSSPSTFLQISPSTKTADISVSKGKNQSSNNEPAVIKTSTSSSSSSSQIPITAAEPAAAAAAAAVAPSCNPILKYSSSENQKLKKEMNEERRNDMCNLMAQTLDCVIAAALKWNITQRELANTVRKYSNSRDSMLGALKYWNRHGEKAVLDQWFDYEEVINENSIYWDYPADESPRLVRRRLKQYDESDGANNYAKSDDDDVNDDDGDDDAEDDDADDDDDDDAKNYAEDNINPPGDEQVRPVRRGCCDESDDHDVNDDDGDDDAKDDDADDDDDNNNDANIVQSVALRTIGVNDVNDNSS